MIAPVDASDFLVTLRAEFPDLVEELDDETWRGLLHVETGCFARYAQAAIDRGDRALVSRCFDFARQAWLSGTPDVRNALAVSFVEHVNFSDGKVKRESAFDLLPVPLRDVAQEMGIGRGYRRP